MRFRFYEINYVLGYYLLQAYTLFQKGNLMKKLHLAIQSFDFTVSRRYKVILNCICFLNRPGVAKGSLQPGESQYILITVISKSHIGLQYLQWVKRMHGLNQDRIYMDRESTKGYIFC